MRARSVSCSRARSSCSFERGGSGRSIPARLARSRATSMKGFFSISPTKLKTSPDLLQPKQ